MTTLPVSTSQKADEDIESAIRHYLESGVADVAEAFIDAFEAAAASNGRYPHLGSIRIADEVSVPGIRSLALDPFPYLIVYLESPRSVRVVRVLHTKRDIVGELSNPLRRGTLDG